MCKIKKRKVDRAVIIYKIFLVALMVVQIYNIFFIVFVSLEIIIHSIILLYLLFRYYILTQTANKAHNADFTLTEFLNDRMTCKEHTEGCDCHDD